MNNPISPIPTAVSTLSKTSRRLVPVSCAFALLLFAGKAGALGLQEIPLPPIAPAPQAITIDGKLDEWKAVSGYRYNPFSQASSSEGDPAMESLLNDPISANVKLCYDSAALFVAVDWKDRQAGSNTSRPEQTWFEGGEGFELHLLTDRALHLACWPSADGKKVYVLGRYGEEKPWREMSQTVAAAGAAVGDGKSYGQELRIPWKAITKAGKTPSNGKMELGLDFTWNATPTALLKRFRKASINSLTTARGVPASFLTSRPNLAGAGYLTNASDWGTFAFGATPSGDESSKGLDGSTSLAEMSVPWAKQSLPLSGSLTGWDSQWFQRAGYLQALWGDRFAGRVAAQFDRDNLYLAAHFSSTSGPFNLKTQATQEGFNGGDAWQVRLSDGKKKINLCGWYDTAARQPALTADGKDLPSPFLLRQGAKETFHADKDGRGYVQELAIPWKLLFGKAPKKGDKLKGTFQFWYADLTPRFSLHAKTSLERQGAISVSYTMPADGQLTLGLYDSHGKLLKWLVQDEFRSAGKNRQAWDGLDQWDKPVPAGSYKLKALYHAPITTDYKMSVCNPGNPPWPTPDDKGDWLGDEHDPQAAATDGKWVFLAAPGCELGYSIMAVDENGRRQWGIMQAGEGRAVSLTLDGDYLYALYSGAELTDSSHHYNGKNAVGQATLLCLDKKTGRPAQFTLETPRLKVATWPYADTYTFLDQLRNQKSFTPATYGGQPRYYCSDVCEPTNALGIAAVGGKLYVSLLFENKLLVLDAKTGKPTGEDIPLPAPVGLCGLDDHSLLAISGRQVVKVDVRSKSAAPVITSNLVAPHSICRDAAGNIYVSDWGTSFQVKAFNSQGRFLHAIGKEGGRPWVGKWEAGGMLVPRGVAVTDEGKLWVAEDDGSPKRISVWDAKTGALLKDYIGPTPYGGGTHFWIDPKDRTVIHTEGARFKVDYAAKTYTPEVVDYRRRGPNDPFTPIGHCLSDDQVRILYHDGHEYAFFNGVERSVSTIMRRYGDTYRPVAAFGGSLERGFNNDGTATIDWDELGYRVYKGFYPDCFKGHQGDSFSWTDMNGDNLVQPDEVHWTKRSRDGSYHQGMERNTGTGWGADVSPDWAYYFVSTFKDEGIVFRLEPTGWTKQGAPIYDRAQAKPIIHVPPKHSIGNVHITADRKIIVCYSFEGLFPGGWNDSTDAIGCFDFDGHELWSIVQPKRLEGKQVHANGVEYDFNIPKLGDVFCTWLYHGSQRPFLITTDGLYVGTMLDITKLGPTALRGESALYYYQTQDGAIYAINGANQAEHIFQIKGLEANSTGRFDAAFRLSAANAQKAAAMREIPEAKLAPKPVIGIHWLQQPPVIDGDLSDWNLNAGVSLDGGNGKNAEVALGRDAKNLYLAYKVHEPNALRNGGADWRTLFISGDCVDLMLQTDPKADANRHSAVAGDKRLLLSLFQGRPIAVLYRPVVSGTAAPERLASAQIDQIIKLDSARVAMRRDAVHGLYTVEAAVPLADLGIDPKRKEDLRGDAGVIFADESGKSRSLRLYYYNHHTEMVEDLATEATLQPNEWGAITMPMGPNLLHNGTFEEPLVDSKEDMDKGWYVSRAVGGSDATLSTESPYTGHCSLLLETPIPVIFPPAEYKNPDYSAFLKSANGGRGGGDAYACQRVSVTGGHLYDFRYHFRSEDLQTELKGPGNPRGYIAFQCWIDWLCPSPHRGSRKGCGGSDYLQPTQHEWQTIFDFNHGWDLPHTYTAPDGAVAANITFRLATMSADHLPKVFVDDVELVDVTPRG